ncbi:glycosyltransferase family 4 protein [Cryobacterium mannosilyticum]|uniref:Glycosyltransferase family 1 protein n=1 Tax=Cryobacterium mannosilyticum TaxID=1259190 RepID=A0A4R8W5Z7_9MICO|nr:glycosyltransferase family 1 protein [Cryobacterium mannosilyticum]TFC01248.1 glycosyltransferase family 1 protein [Cryobacterium mannosilyticum]
MSRVLVDLLFFTGRKGGMESYVREVYSRIEPGADGLEFIGLASRELAAELATELAPGDTGWFPGEIVDSGISGENRIAWARGELFGVARFARRLGADLVHCPANLGPAWSPVPVVLTVHDLLPFRHPEYVPGAYSRVLRTMIRLAARGARRILTVSAASRSDIVRYLRIPASRVDVVPLAGQDQEANPTQLPRLPRQLLAVGNRMPHKNFPLLLEALSLIPEGARPHLVVTGSHGDDPLTPVVARLGLEPWVSLRGWLHPDELDRLYAESSLIVFPTLFEGFGLPVLEAMSRGCPVVCADLPVLHEVAGDAAVYVSPHDAAALAATISELLDDPAELARRSGLGRDRASTFSWATTAQGTVASLQRALAER